MSTKADEAINPHTFGIYETGLTKREYFATMAMQGFSTLEHVSPELAAKQSVAYADALIKELNK